MLRMDLESVAKLDVIMFFGKAFEQVRVFFSERGDQQVCALELCTNSDVFGATVMPTSHQFQQLGVQLTGRLTECLDIVNDFEGVFVTNAEVYQFTLQLSQGQGGMDNGYFLHDGTSLY